MTTFNYIRKKETLKQLNLTNCVEVLEDINFKWGISYLPD